MRNSLVVGTLGLFFVMIGCSSCTRVGPGYAGIKVSYAGSNRGVSDYPVTTGWVLYNPFAATVVEYPTFVQTAVWTATTSEGNPIDESITFTTKDSMQVHADISLAYSLEFEKVPAFYIKFRNDDLKVFTHGFLRNLARQKFDEAAGHYSIEQIMGDNATFLKETKDALQTDLTPIGVVLQQFGFIGAPKPPQGIIDSINVKVQASQIAMQKQAEVAQAEADARKRIVDANAYAQSGLIQADAQAKANKILSESLTTNLVELKRIEKWDGHLPQTSLGGNSGTFVSLGGK